MVRKPKATLVMIHSLLSGAFTGWGLTEILSYAAAKEAIQTAYYSASGNITPEVINYAQDFVAQNIQYPWIGITLTSAGFFCAAAAYAYQTYEEPAKPEDKKDKK